jgi:hypothetical protein
MIFAISCLLLLLKGWHGFFAIFSKYLPGYDHAARAFIEVVFPRVESLPLHAQTRLGGWHLFDDYFFC